MADGATIRETVIAMGYVERGEITEEQLDEALDVASMTRPLRATARRRARRSIAAPSSSTVGLVPASAVRYAVGAEVHPVSTSCWPA